MEITIDENGVYLVSVIAKYATNSNVQIRINGNVDIVSESFCISKLMTLKKNDIIQAYVWNASGAEYSVTADYRYFNLQATRILKQ